MGFARCAVPHFGKNERLNIGMVAIIDYDAGNIKSVEKAAFYNKRASFFRINEQLYHITKELENKGISIAMHAADFLNGYDLQKGKTEGLS